MGCSCSKRADDAPDATPERQPPAPPPQPATPPRQEARLPATPPSPPSGSSTASVDRASPVPPSPPKEWRASIEEDVSDGESPTKDVEIELGERHEEEDDDFGGDNAVAFADACVSSDRSPK